MKIKKNKIYKLVKLKTRNDAKYPQKEKYPDGIMLGMGFVKLSPVVGKSFFLFENNNIPSCYTSTVVDIKKEKEKLILTTENSVYELSEYDFGNINNLKPKKK